MTKPTGGRAFPVPIVHHENIGVVASDYQGMTLRDYLAATALEGILSNPDRRDDISHTIKQSYLLADAMIAEGNK